jgi:hypothetical protein
MAVSTGGGVGHCQKTKRFLSQPSSNFRRLAHSRSISQTRPLLTRPPTYLFPFLHITPTHNTHTHTHTHSLEQVCGLWRSRGEHV